ncbi:MAG: 1,4-dihydroxy-6-naphthoate synthase [Fibrobacter sp.]|nr:1,4-dihydroxy-6-naphthoate synthase [Fibrobacter sp.]
MSLRLGISTCPNDTFIYEALVRGLKNSEFQWNVTFADVQTLNEMVLAGELDVAKVSCGVLPLVQNKYQLLSCGGAMGYGCGPLLLSAQSPAKFDPSKETVLPGKNTTASLLFRFWYAKTQGVEPPKVSYAFFNEVYDGLLLGKNAQGVVIHEKRFTWERDHLGLLTDLGAFWEAETESPIPLGCSVAKKTLGSSVIQSVEAEIRQSLDMAHARTEPVTDFIREKAQIPDDSVILKHIRMFVTDFTRDMGEPGRKALRILAEHVSL